jgi:hypothetical protein
MDAPHQLTAARQRRFTRSDAARNYRPSMFEVDESPLWRVGVVFSRETITAIAAPADCFVRRGLPAGCPTNGVAARRDAGP